MQRTSKIVYADDAGRELFYIKNSKVDIASATSCRLLNADEADDLALALRAAAEELRATAEKEAVA
jgi:hypothetical protein